MMYLQEIIEAAGIRQVSEIERLYGGDINSSYCISSGTNKFFLKTNESSQYPAMLEKEANGLAELSQHSSFHIPAVLGYGNINNRQYLLLEWIEKGTLHDKFWETFAGSLAGMHRVTHDHYGWKENNYIGSLPQLNNIRSDWASFYAENRVLPLVIQGNEKGLFTKQDINRAISLSKKLIDLFPLEKPSLLHGDLWGGNFMINFIGKPAIFDPAVYYGHREMDIGMTLLFGGFDAKFYHYYQEYYPLETGWEQRLQLTQLYPLLVHALLFGGQYVSQCRGILSRFS